MKNCKPPRTHRVYTFVMRNSFGLIKTERGVDLVLILFVIISFTITYVQFNKAFSPAETVLVPALGEGTGTRGL